MADNLEIKITAPGAQQAADDVREVAKATEGVGDSTRSAGRAFAETNPLVDDFGRRGGEGRLALMELDAVMRGGTESLFGLAGAWRSLTLALAENPFTAIAAVIFAVAIPAYEYLKKTFEDTAKANAEAMQKMKDETAKRVEEIDKLKLTEFLAELKAVQQSAEDTAKALLLTLDTMEKIADAKLAADKAQIKSDVDSGKLTHEAGAIQEAELEQKRAIEKRTADKSKNDISRVELDDKARAADAALQKARAEQAAAEETARKKADRVQAEQAEIAALDGKLAEANQRTTAEADSGIVLPVPEGGLETGAQMQAAEDRSNYLKDRQAARGGEAASAADLARGAAEETKKAEEEARIADHAADQGDKAAAIKNSGIDAAGVEEDRRRQNETADAIAKARAQDEKAADAEAARINEANAATEGDRVGNAGRFKSPTPAGQKAIDEAARAGQHLADHGGVSEAEAAIAALTALNKQVAEHLVYLNGKPVLQRDVVGEIDRLKDIVAGLKSSVDSKL